MASHPSEEQAIEVGKCIHCGRTVYKICGFVHWYNSCECEIVREDEDEDDE